MDQNEKDLLGVKERSSRIKEEGATESCRLFTPERGSDRCGRREGGKED